MSKSDVIDLILAVTRWGLEIGLRDRDPLSPDPLDIKAVLSKAEENVLCFATQLWFVAKMPEDLRKLLILEWRKRKGEIKDWKLLEDETGCSLTIEEVASRESEKDVLPSGS